MLFTFLTTSINAQYIDNQAILDSAIIKYYDVKKLDYVTEKITFEITKPIILFKDYQRNFCCFGTNVVLIYYNNRNYLFYAKELMKIIMQKYKCQVITVFKDKKCQEIAYQAYKDTNHSLKLFDCYLGTFENKALNQNEFIIEKTK
jgi:hypothetical protein